MKALSIKQPWADLIAKGIKDVENRSWFTATRGRVYIHAGKILDEISFLDIINNTALYGVELPLKEDLTLGAIIGEVDIIDCKFRKASLFDSEFSAWHEVGKWGFYLANPVLYDKPIPCRGQLGFFEVDINGETEYSKEFRRE